jgi:hypothetical protein
LANEYQTVYQKAFGVGASPLIYSVQGALIAYFRSRVRVPPGQYRVPTEVVVLNATSGRRLVTDLRVGPDIYAHPKPGASALIVGTGGAFAYVSEQDDLGLVDGRGQQTIDTSKAPDFTGMKFEGHTFTWHHAGLTKSVAIVPRTL